MNNFVYITLPLKLVETDNFKHFFYLVGNWLRENTGSKIMLSNTFLNILLTPTKQLYSITFDIFPITTNLLHYYKGVLSNFTLLTLS